MKKLLISMLAIICSVIGFQKMADKFDVTIKNNAIDSERNIATNGGRCGSKKGKVSPPSSDTNKTDDAASV